MKSTKPFLLGACIGTILGFIMSMFDWMFHYDAVPHYLYPLIYLLYFPLWIGSFTTGPLIDGFINLLIEFDKTPTKYGDWPYQWDGLYKWLVAIHILIWMAISYGLIFLLITKITRHFKKLNKKLL